MSSKYLRAVLCRGVSSGGHENPQSGKHLSRTETEKQTYPRRTKCNECNTVPSWALT